MTQAAQNLLFYWWIASGLIIGTLIGILLVFRVDRKEAMRRAAYWQQECGEQVEIIAKLWPDANKYRVARAARLKREAARSTPLANLKAQTTNAGARDG